MGKRRKKKAVAGYAIAIRGYPEWKAAVRALAIERGYPSEHAMALALIQFQAEACGVTLPERAPTPGGPRKGAGKPKRRAT